MKCKETKIKYKPTGKLSYPYRKKCRTRFPAYYLEFSIGVESLGPMPH